MLEVVFLTGTRDYQLLEQRIAEYAIDWPVLVYNSAEYVPKSEWQVLGKPDAYLINPQGVIAGCGLGTSHLSDLLTGLEFYTSPPEPDPPLGLRCSWNLDDLPELVLLLELRSPRRQPLEVEIDYRYVDGLFDDSGKLIEVNRICPVEDGPELSFTVSFDDSCELRWPVAIDAQDYEALEFVVAVRIPGSEEMQDGRGVWTWQGGELVYGQPEYCRERAWSSFGW